MLWLLGGTRAAPPGTSPFVMGCSTGHGTDRTQGSYRNPSEWLFFYRQTWGTTQRTVREKLGKALNYHSPDSLNTSLSAGGWRSKAWRLSVPTPNSCKVGNKWVGDGRRPCCIYEWIKWNMLRLPIHVEQPLALGSWSMTQPRPLAWPPPYPCSSCGLSSAHLGIPHIFSPLCQGRSCPHRSQLSDVTGPRSHHSSCHQSQKEKKEFPPWSIH